MHLERSRQKDAADFMPHSTPSLILITWLLSSLLVLLVILRLLYSSKVQARRQTRPHDDVLIVLVCLCAVASILSMPTTATPTAARSTTNVVQTRGAIVKSYVSTTMFTVALGLSKMPIICWLHRLKLARSYRVFTMTIGGAILGLTIASLTSIIFQCNLPRPLDIRVGRCISTQTFWTCIVAIEITFDMVLIIVPVIIVTSVGSQQRSEKRVPLILSLRTLLVVASLARLVYLQQPALADYSSPLKSLPYAIATQCQVAMATVLACAPTLPCLASFIKASPRDNQVTLKKHGSGSSFGSDIATDYFASAPSTPVKEPLSAIQASMANLTSSRQQPRHSSASSLSIPSGTKSAPPRPPPPSAEQRPDMRMFVRRPTVMRPPPVTLLRNSRDHGLGRHLSNHGCDVDKGEVRVSRHVKFVV